jgi:hypothetical protein
VHATGCEWEAVLVAVSVDRITDERENDLERRLAALEAREAAFVERVRAVEEILAAADQRGRPR